MDYFKTFDENQGNVIDSLKMLLYQRHSDIFERLDFENDSIYLEPLLYSYVTQDDEIWLDSIIYGYETNPKSLIPIFTNKKGIVYIPKIGYFRTTRISEQLFLEKLNGNYQIKDANNSVISYNFEPIIFLNDGIELIKTQHPLFENLFLNNKNVVVDVDIDNCFDKHLNHFNNALQVMKDNYSEYFNLIKKAVNKVMMYDGEPYSFAAIQAHNMIFLNCKDENDEIFFLDHILHEGAHVIFNTLTYDSKIDLFTFPFKTDLSVVTKDENEHGELYGRFHGMFTQSNINPCMEICIDRNIFTGKQHRELLGRFSSNMTRFKAGVDKFNIPHLYKEEGRKWYEFFNKRYNELYIRKNELVNSFDISNQPYVFSYEIFDKTNP